MEGHCGIRLLYSSMSILLFNWPISNNCILDCSAYTWHHQVFQTLKSCQIAVGRSSWKAFLRPRSWKYWEDTFCHSCLGGYIFEALSACHTWVMFFRSYQYPSAYYISSNITKCWPSLSRNTMTSSHISSKHSNSSSISPSLLPLARDLQDVLNVLKPWQWTQLMFISTGWWCLHVWSKH